MAFILIAEDNETIADSLSFFGKNFARYPTLVVNSADVAYDTLKKNKAWMNRIAGTRLDN